MAEESGKGIALVILGIVAVIAIVGLVLLFTGYKGASGQFAVPSAKEYGGAIKGVYDPYSRAFAGRAMDYTSGVEDEFSAQTSMFPGESAGTSGTAYGGINPARGTSNPTTYNNVLTQAAVFFQASANQGTVRAGDSCYIMPPAIAGITWTSDASRCALAEQQGTAVHKIEATCTGDISRSRIQQSGGYGAMGQSVVADDPYLADVTSDVGKACAIRFSGLAKGAGLSGTAYT